MQVIVGLKVFGQALGFVAELLATEDSLIKICTIFKILLNLNFKK